MNNVLSAAKEPRSKLKIPRTASGQTALIWSLIAIGTFVRVRIYVANRSLWSDEAMLALNIIHKPINSLLTQRLEYEQAAPPGFLLLEKWIVNCMGPGEYSLRLLPLLSGIATMVLVYQLAKRFTSALPTILAVAMTAFCKGLIEQSVFVKQYETDTAIGLLVLLTSIPLMRDSLLRVSALLIFSLTAALAIWFSHPAVFTVAGASIASFIYQAYVRNWRNVMSIAVAVTPAVLGLAVEYFLLLRHLENSSYLHHFWIGGFLPLPLEFARTIRWCLTVPVLLMASPGGYKTWGVAPLCFVLGVIWLYRRKNTALLLLTAPILLALAAAALQKYPFTGRLALFALPLLFIVSSIGIASLSRWLGAPAGTVCAAILALLLMVPSVARTCQWTIKPEPMEEIKPVLAYIHHQMKPDDILFIYHATQPAFFYYQSTAGLDSAKIYLCKNCEAQTQRADVCRLAGCSRVWVVLTHDDDGSPVSLAQPMLDSLNAHGRKLEQIIGPGGTARAYLYDLSA